MPSKKDKSKKENKSSTSHLSLNEERAIKKKFREQQTMVINTYYFK